ncbi:MAG: DUF362 domain-containing protein [Spirochaetales bacterium]|nr:DUF362 domain-containing protein [Spirochaetales bacterium]
MEKDHHDRRKKADPLDVSPNEKLLRSQTSIPGKNYLSSKATVYRSVNGSPAQNCEKVIELLGGIACLFGEHDVILCKPNVQWWNQGAPNIGALNRFVELVMGRPGGFYGEVVFIENVHRGCHPWESDDAGWNRLFVRNVDLEGVHNYNEFCGILKQRYGDAFTVKHLIDSKSGGRRVYSPEDGEGFVLCDGTGGVPLLSCDNGMEGSFFREVIMSYPVFKTDRGTRIDFKHGIWENGGYSKRPLRFVNIAALNHHSPYCGITGCMKNLLGINDLSGGPDPYLDGKLTGSYYNFHSFPFDKWQKGPANGMLGKEIGMFLKTVRSPDLNITTAEWTGLASRTEPPLAHTRTVLAGKDLVALDYHGSKYLVYANSGIPFHNPDNENRPLHDDLAMCGKESGLSFDERTVSVRSFDWNSSRLQAENEYARRVKRTWGTDPKSLGKYMLYRWRW